jgi:hypothetical protein
VRRTVAGRITLRLPNLPRRSRFRRYCQTGICASHECFCAQTGPKKWAIDSVRRSCDFSSVFIGAWVGGSRWRTPTGDAWPSFEDRRGGRHCSSGEQMFPGREAGLLSRWTPMSSQNPSSAGIASRDEKDSPDGMCTSDRIHHPIHTMGSGARRLISVIAEGRLVRVLPLPRHGVTRRNCPVRRQSPGPSWTGNSEGVRESPRTYSTGSAHVWDISFVPTENRRSCMTLARPITFGTDHRAGKEAAALCSPAMGSAAQCRVRRGGRSWSASVFAGFPCLPGVARSHHGDSSPIVASAMERIGDCAIGDPPS